jgi:hypothetical protein
MRVAEAGFSKMEEHPWAAEIEKMVSIVSMPVDGRRLPMHAYVSKVESSLTRGVCPRIYS